MRRVQGSPCGIRRRLTDLERVPRRQISHGACADPRNHRRRDQPAAQRPPGRGALKPHSDDWNPPDSRGDGRDDGERD
jgi:hypothetical protein